jgi:hypothetical protein
MNQVISVEDKAVIEVNRTQLQHFKESDPRCRALQLPEGIMLRYNLSQSLFFYLRTGVADGKITTRVFATDSPYEWQKTSIGEVSTPIFEPRADLNHLEKVQRLLHTWVDFINATPESDHDFKSFALKESRE